jgi:hypothetical protein
LGAPVVFRFADHQVPTSILQDPPKHLDWFYDPQQKHGSWLQVDRSNSLNLTVTDSSNSSYESQTTTGSDWTIGSSVTANVTASTEAGLGKVANAGGGLDVSAEIRQQGGSLSWIARPWYRTKVAVAFPDLLTALRQDLWRTRFPAASAPARRLQKSAPMPHHARPLAA